MFTGEMHQKVSPLVNSCQQWRNVSFTQNDTALRQVCKYLSYPHCKLSKRYLRLQKVMKNSWCQGARRDLAQHLSARRKHPLRIIPCIWISTYLKIHLPGFRLKSLWKTVCVLGILDAKLSCFCSVLFNCRINQVQLLKALEGRM